MRKKNANGKRWNMLIKEKKRKKPAITIWWEKSNWLGDIVSKGTVNTITVFQSPWC